MNIFDLFDRLTKLTLNTEPSSSSHVVCEGRMSHLGIINFNGYSFLLLKILKLVLLASKNTQTPKTSKKRMFSRSTKLPGTGALDHGGPLKGEDAERCSPNYKIQLGLNIGTRPMNLTIMLVKTSHRALLDIFSSRPSLDPGISKPPHQRRCRVPSDRGAAHLGKSAIWRLISITILITFFRQEQLTAASSFGERQKPPINNHQQHHHIPHDVKRNQLTAASSPARP